MANDKKLNSAGKTRAKQAKGQETGPEPKPAKPTTNVRSTATTKKVPATAAAKAKAPTQATDKAAAPRSNARRKAIPETEPARSGTKAAGRRDANQAATLLSAEERDNMVRMAAYFKAEKRQFAPGNEAQDWAEAEREVDEWLRQHQRTR